MSNSRVINAGRGKINEIVLCFGVLTLLFCQKISSITAKEVRLQVVIHNDINIK